MHKIKFAVVGCGHIGKRHIEMIQNRDDALVVAACDIRAYDTLALPISADIFFDDIHEMLLQKPEIEVVCVASPNGLHETHALAALHAGKHVVIEKPMALSKQSGERIIQTALSYGKQVFCVMQNRYSPPAIWLKEVIEKGILGKIYMVNVQCFWNRDDRYYKKGNWHGTADMDGGTLFTQFSHFVDMLYWLLGDITDIQRQLHNFNHSHSIDFEDSGTILFTLAQGGMGSLQYTTAVWDKNMESSMTLIAENGSIKVGGQYMNEVSYCHIKDYKMPLLPPSNPPNDYGTYKGSAANHHFVFQNVIEVLAGKAKISTTALEGLKVVEIIERIYGRGK